MHAQYDTAAIDGLEPALVWQFFAGMSAVPRPSKQEEKIRKHVKQVAGELGMDVTEEAVGNLIIKVPASPGCEGAPIVTLQAHLDMVCEKNAGTEHDFDNEGIRLVLAKEASTGKQILRADGTTLGADNGVGVAMALAAATSPDVTHGPLELLFTIDEEAGMTGAKALTPNSIRGKILLNLDSEEDNALYIGCAGGCDSTLRWTFPFERVETGMREVRLTVNGLRGGHSGGDIHENRGNAIKLLARVLAKANVDGLQIVEITGGSKRNAIPREAHAKLLVPPEGDAALRAAARMVCEEGLLNSREPSLAINGDATSCGDTALSAADTLRLISALAALPHGVLGMSPDVPGLVQTSNNVATITSRADSAGLVVEVGTLSRSSSTSWLHVTCEQIAAVGRLSGATVENANEYPGWEPNVDSPVLATCRRIYGDMFGESAHVAAIHAGLECGIIGERVGGMDMVSFGPTITGAHSPDELIYVDSVGKSWKYLQAVLAELAKG